MEMQQPDDFKKGNPVRQSGRAYAHKLKEAIKRMSSGGGKKGTSIDDVSEQWKVDFSHRPSWCDAGMALEQIRRGKAKGNCLNKLALWVRSMMQRFLFTLGCFIQSYCFAIFFLLVLIGAIFCIGLRDVSIQTDIVKLWVEQNGRLDEELNFLHRIKQYTAPDAAIVPASVTLEKSTLRRTKRESGNDEPPKNAAASLGGGFQVVIQTPRKSGLNILTQEDLLLHTAVLENVTKMTVHLYGEDWSLRDMCFKPPAPSGPGTADFVSELLDAIIPCVMITPLDCFWEGAKPLGPFPGFPLPSLAGQFLPALANVYNMTWKNLNPKGVMVDLKDTLRIDLGMIENIFDRAGVGVAYQNRSCIDPLDFECPTTAPNFFNPCNILHSAEFHDRNNASSNPIVLESEEITPCEQLLEYHDTHVSDPDFIADVIGKKRRKRQSGSNVNATTNTAGTADYNALDKDYYADYYGTQGSKEIDTDDLLGGIFGGASKDDNEYACYTFSDLMCLQYRKSLTKWLRANRDRWDELIPKELQPKVPIFGDHLTNGCGGFAKEILNWPEDLIIGGVRRESVSKKVLTAEALQSVTLLAGGGEMYGRFIHNTKKKPNLDRARFTPAHADHIINTWQRKFTDMLYNHANNSDPNADRQVHPLAGTSIGDMMAEFSKFKYTVIITGYFLMLLYAGISLIILEDHGIESCCGLGFQGVILVTFASASGLGLSTLCGIEFNAATTQIVPFLSLGLGVDDMFLLVHNYKDIVKTVNSHEIGYLMKETGLSVLLTSINNILAFLAGGMLPVPALRSFCIQTAILLFFNVIAILTMYPALIAFDLMRRKARRSDIFVFLQWPEDEASLRKASMRQKKIVKNGYVTDSSQFDTIEEEETKTGGWRNFVNLHKFVSNVYIPLLQKKVTKVLVCVLGALLFAVGVFGITQIRQGLELTDVIPKDTAPYAFLAAREKYFSFYPMFGVIKGPGVDFAKQQSTVSAYRDKIAANKFTVANQGKLGDAYWMDMMHKWLRSLQDVWDTIPDGTHHNYTMSEEQLLARTLFCNTGAKVDCSRATNKSVRFFDNATGLIREDSFYKYLTAWYHQDQMMYHVSQAAFYPAPPHWAFQKDKKMQSIPPAKPFLYSQIPFFLNNLKDTPLTVEAISEIREICDEFTNERGLPNFPQGIPFTFWEQYLHLNANLIKAMLLITLMVFVVISVLLMSPWTAALVVLTIMMMNVELAGYMGLVGLKLNPVSAVTLITAIGIGVEFTVHISLAYLTSLGSNNDRLARTLEHMFVPVIQGGLSTLLGIIMLAFSEFEFIVRYFFLVMSALILLGLFNGLALLPVMLSLFGPPCEVHTLDGADTLPPPSPRTPARPRVAPAAAPAAAPPTTTRVQSPVYVDAGGTNGVPRQRGGVDNAGFPTTDSQGRFDYDTTRGVVSASQHDLQSHPSVQVVVHNHTGSTMVSSSTAAGNNALVVGGGSDSCSPQQAVGGGGANTRGGSLISGARNSLLLGLASASGVAGSPYEPLNDRDCSVLPSANGDASATATCVPNKMAQHSGGGNRPSTDLHAGLKLGPTALKLGGAGRTSSNYRNLSDDNEEDGSTSTYSHSNGSQSVPVETAVTIPNSSTAERHGAMVPHAF